MGNELLAIYYYNHKQYDVYGCWDEETPENTFDFYDIFESGICINEGEPFDVLPTREDVIDFIEQ